MAHRLAPQAAAELDDIWFAIARESGSIERADRVVDGITRRFHLLATHPRIGRERSDLRPGLRGFPVDAYILYRIEGEDVLILHVLDGRRDIAALVMTPEASRSTRSYGIAAPNPVHSDRAPQDIEVSQFSTATPGYFSKSRVLLVTTVAPSATEWAAINLSR